jgi:hypothetical protein
MGRSYPTRAPEHGESVAWDAATADGSTRWALWFLGSSFSVYEQFRDTADAFANAHPNLRFGSALIVERMRFMTSARIKDDTFKINNNVRSLLARLYLLERPTAKLETRKSWFDRLNPAEREIIIAAFVEAGGVIATPSGVTS